MAFPNPNTVCCPSLTSTSHSKEVYCIHHKCTVRPESQDCLLIHVTGRLTLFGYTHRRRATRTGRATASTERRLRTTRPTRSSTSARNKCVPWPALGMRTWARGMGICPPRMGKQSAGTGDTRPGVTGSGTGAGTPRSAASTAPRVRIPKRTRSSRAKRRTGEPSVICHKCNRCTRAVPKPKASPFPGTS